LLGSRPFDVWVPNPPDSLLPTKRIRLCPLLLLAPPLLVSTISRLLYYEKSRFLPFYFYANDRTFFNQVVSFLLHIYPRFAKPVSCFALLSTLWPVLATSDLVRIVTAAWFPPDIEVSGFCRGHRRNTRVFLSAPFLLVYARHSPFFSSIFFSRCS